MASRVAFTPPTGISHKPTNPPPTHYAGCATGAGTLKTSSGGYTTTWSWAPSYQEWNTENGFIRVYWDDHTYTVHQGSVLMETGAWHAVA